MTLNPITVTNLGLPLNRFQTRPVNASSGIRRLRADMARKLLMITGKKLFELHLNGEGLGLPDDAQIREVYYDPSVDLIEFIVESDELPTSCPWAKPL